jgi:hypothetical protein
MANEFALPEAFDFSEINSKKPGLKGGEPPARVLPNTFQPSGPIKDEGYTPTPGPDWKDIGLAAASSFPAGVVQSFGQPGEIQKFAPEVSPFIARTLGGLYSSLTGQPNPIEAMQNKYEKQEKEIRDRFSPREQELARTSARLEQPLKFPTGEQLMDEPKTPEGKVVSEIGKFSGNVAGVGPGAIKRGLQGVVGEGLAQTYVTNSPDSGETPYVKSLFELLGMGAASGAGQLAKGAETRASEQLSSILRDAYNKGKIKNSPEQIIAAQKAGIPLSFADVADPETRNALEQFAAISGKTEPIGNYNLGISNRSKGYMDPFVESQQRLKNTLEGFIETPQGARITPSFGPSPSTTFKPSLDPSEISARIAAENKGEIDRVYNLARSNPAAQNIPASSFDSTLIAAPAFKTAFDEAATTAANRNVGKSISDPDYVKVPYIDKNTGQEVAGNLPFWDLVKRRVDQTISKSIRDGSDADLADAMRIKDSLLKGLDPIIPEYGAARSFASESFGAAESPIAGLNAYLDNKNLINRTQAANSFRSAPKIEQEGMRQGWLGGLNEDIQSGKLNSVVNRIQTDNNFKEMGRLFLGDEKFATLESNLIAEGIKNKAQEMNVPNLKEIPSKSKIPGFATLGAAAVGIGSIAQQAFSDVIQLSFLDPNLMVPGAVTAVGVYSGKKISEARLKGMASRMVPMFTSTDPEVTQRLATLIKDVPEARAFADAMWKRLNAVESGVEEYETQQEREGRATGGRTMVKDPRKNAATLMALADKIKKEQSQDTSSLLNLDDETVAKALAVANKHI